MSRLGTTAVFAVLAVIAFLFLITGHWILTVIFGLAAAASWFVLGVKRSTGR
jgi:hypothetical protein